MLHHFTLPFRISISVAIMLPTPSTSHVDYDRIYEPAEDSYLLLDTLSLPNETAFLSARFASSPAPLICEVGTGSGVVLAFVTANASTIFGRPDILSLGTDLNIFACQATSSTVNRAIRDQVQHNKDGFPGTAPHFLGAVNTDLTSALLPSQVDVLIFNPPYVPAPMPNLSDSALHHIGTGHMTGSEAFDRDSHLLSLSYAGGEDGMEVTNKLLEQLPDVLTPERGVAYVLLCAQNKPQEIAARVLSWPGRWTSEVVGSSGKKAGWEKLVVLRILRNPE